MGFRIKREGQIIGREESQIMMSQGMRASGQGMSEEEKKKAFAEQTKMISQINANNPTLDFSKSSQHSINEENSPLDKKNILFMSQGGASNMVNVDNKNNTGGNKMNNQEDDFSLEIKNIINKAKGKLNTVTAQNDMENSQAPEIPQISQKQSQSETIDPVKEKANLMLKHNALLKKAKWKPNDKNIKLEIAQIKRAIKKLEKK